MSHEFSTATVWRLTAITFIGGLGGGVVFPIIPIEGLRLGISAGLIGLILSFNRITRLAVNPLSGRLVDRVGPRLPLAVGLAVEAVAVLCFNAGLHSDWPGVWFLLGRGLWGIGSSLLIVGAMTAALLFSNGPTRGMATAKVRMGLSFGMPGGLVLGGLIADLVSADTAFLAASAIALAGMVGAFVFVPPVARAKTSAGTSSPRRHAGRWQRLKPLLRPGPIWIVWCFNFVMFFSVQGVILASLVVIVEQRSLTVFGLRAQGTSGIFMAAMIGASALVSLLIGRHLDRTVQRTGLLVPAALLLTVGYVLLATAETSLATAAALCCVGVALGGTNIPLMVILGDLTTADRYGRTIGVYQMLGDMGGSLGPMVGLAAIEHFGSRSTLLTVALVAVLTVPLALLLRIRELRRARLCHAD